VLFCADAGFVRLTVNVVSALFGTVSPDLIVSVKVPVFFDHEAFELTLDTANFDAFDPAIVMDELSFV
jgi:hypothetical protein